MNKLTTGQLRAVLEELPIPRPGTQLDIAVRKMRDALDRGRQHNRKREEKREQKGATQ